MATHKPATHTEAHEAVPHATPPASRNELAGFIMASMCSACHPDDMKAAAPGLAAASVIAAEALIAELNKPAG